MSTQQTKQLQAHKDARTEAFLRAAAETFCKRGLRQTTMDHVAAAAGVSKVVLYRYFSSKSHLVHAVLEQAADRLIELHLDEEVWWGTHLRRSLEASHKDQPAMILLLRHSAHDLEFGRHFERLNSFIVTQTHDRLARHMGPMVKRGSDEMFLARTITTFIIENFIRWLESGDPDLDREFGTWLRRSVNDIANRWASR